MLIQILIYAKHHLPFIWNVIEWLNGLLFGLFYAKKVYRTAQQMLDQVDHPDYEYRILWKTDLPALEYLLNSQDDQQYRYFNPHKLDGKSLLRLYRNPSFLMMGVFENAPGRLVGYFFLRFFLNRKGFIGRMVDKNYQRRGIASLMSEVMYQTLWKNRFRCLSTISKHNRSILKLHEQENRLRVLKELPNDYLFVEIAMPGGNSDVSTKFETPQSASQRISPPGQMHSVTNGSGKVGRKKLKTKPNKLPKDHLA